MVFPSQLRLVPASGGTMFAEWFDLWLSLVLPIRPPPDTDRLAGSLIGQCLGEKERTIETALQRFFESDISAVFYQGP